MIQIVPAGLGDVHEIARLAGVVWHAHYPGIISREQIDYMLAKMYDLDVLRREMSEGITYIRLLEKGEMIAFASYGPDGAEMKLHKLYVHPQQQRHGFGRALLDYVERASRERTLILTVNKRNHQAIAAYR